MRLSPVLPTRHIEETLVPGESERGFVRSETVRTSYTFQPGEGNAGTCLRTWVHGVTCRSPDPAAPAEASGPSVRAGTAATALCYRIVVSSTVCSRD